MHTRANLLPIRYAPAAAVMFLCAIFSIHLDAADQEPAQEEPPVTRIDLTVEVPATIESFDSAAIVAILFEFDPRLADVGATEVDRVVVRHLGHQQGVNQTLRFTIGDKLAAVRADRRYYVSCRIYEDLGEDTFKKGEQIHYCHNEHDRLPGTAYDQANGRNITFIAR